MFRRGLTGWTATTEVPPDGPWVAVDFDGVLTRPHALKAAEMTRLGHPCAAHESSREYVLHRKGIPLAAYEAAIAAVNVDRLKEVPLEEGAAAALQAWTRGGYRIAVVTSRYRAELQAAMAYLDQHGLPVDLIVNTDRGSKLDQLAALRPRLFVDDTASKLAPLLADPSGAAVHPRLAGCRLVFFRNEANAHEAAPWPAVREVGGWKDLADLLP